MEVNLQISGRMIQIASKRCKRENLLKRFPGAIIADVTSQATDGLVKLSPFYPHGDIPVPFSEGYTAASVEGIWQGLKVFAQEDVDLSLFANTTMKQLKRTVRKHGPVLGHRKGVKGTEILGYVEAKHQIYIPTYRWMLISSSDCARPAKQKPSFCWITTPVARWMIRRNHSRTPIWSRPTQRGSILTAMRSRGTHQTHK